MGRGQSSRVRVALHFSNVFRVGLIMCPNRKSKTENRKPYTSESIEGGIFSLQTSGSVQTMFSVSIALNTICAAVFSNIYLTGDSLQKIVAREEPGFAWCSQRKGNFCSDSDQPNQQPWVVNLYHPMAWLPHSFPRVFIFVNHSSEFLFGYLRKHCGSKACHGSLLQ